MAGGGDVATAGCHLVDAPPDFGAHVSGRGAWAGEHELAVNTTDESNAVSVGALQACQVVAGLARVQQLGAHLYDVGEDRVDPAARVLVDQDAETMSAVVNALGVRPDEAAPDGGRQKELLLGAPVIAVP